MTELGHGVPTKAMDTPTEPKRSEASLGELFSEVTSELSTLMRQELELAKVEARQEASRAVKGGGLLVGAGLAGWLALVMASLALAWLIDQALNRALAFLIVAVAWAVAALALFVVGQNHMKALRGLPETRVTLKEDVEWAKAQKS